MQAETIHNQEKPELGETNNLERRSSRNNEACLMFDLNINSGLTLSEYPTVQLTTVPGLRLTAGPIFGPPNIIYPPGRKSGI
jgi:hypothetical protein